MEIMPLPEDGEWSWTEGPRWADGPYGQDDGAAFGDFGPGSPVSRWALARYLVGRAVIDSVTRSLLFLGLLVLGLAALVGWGAHQPFWALLIALVGLGVLVMRAALRAIVSRLIAARTFRPLERRLRTLVSQTRADVLAELRRVGLPGRTLTLPLLAWRLVRRASRDRTVSRLRTFEIDRAVPRDRLDELQLIMGDALARPRSDAGPETLWQ